jgi:CRISPR/Cas system CSM-associated protein Csm4 (group 5 of RAMP superfamily)
VKGGESSGHGKQSKSSNVNLSSFRQISIVNNLSKIDPVRSVSGAPVPPWDQLLPYPPPQQERTLSEQHPQQPKSKAKTKTLISQLLWDRWRSEWATSPKGATTKLFFPSAEPSKPKTQLF